MPKVRAALPDPTPDGERTGSLRFLGTADLWKIAKELADREAEDARSTHLTYTPNLAQNPFGLKDLCRGADCEGCETRCFAERAAGIPRAENAGKLRSGISNHDQLGHLNVSVVEPLAGNATSRLQSWGNPRGVCCPNQ
jgi:hypothetical protein